MISLKFFAKIIAWASIFLILVSLIGIGVYSYIISNTYPYEIYLFDDSFFF